MNISDQGPSTDRYQNEVGVIQWAELGYWHVKFTQGNNVSLDPFSELMVFASENRDYKVPVIVEREFSYSANLDVYQFVQELLPMYVSALVFVCYSSTTADICQHICSNYMGDIPTKVVFDMDEAVCWVSENFIGKPRIPTGA